MDTSSTTESVRLQRYATERRQSLLNSLAYMKDVKFLTDITLLCDGQPYPAHRVTLAASSAYFRDIFQRKQKVSRVNVHDVDHETFQSVLDFLYTGKLRLECLEGVKLAKVLSAFRGLDVHCLDNVTSCILVSVLNMRNYFAMWDMVKELKLKDAENTVVKYVASNLKECCQNQNFTLLTLQQMVSVLSSKHLTSESGKSILEAVAMWGSYQQERRSKYLTSLLSVVGLNPDPMMCKELMCFERSHPVNFRQDGCDGKINPMPGKSEMDEKSEKENLRNKVERFGVNKGRPQEISGQNQLSKTMVKKVIEHDVDVTYDSKNSLKPNRRQKWKTPDTKQKEDDTEATSPNELSPHEIESVNSPNSVETFLINTFDSDLPKWTQNNGKNVAGCDSILCLGCDHFGMPIQQSYCPVNKQWSAVKRSIKFNLAKTSTIYFDGFIYAVGGESENGDKVATVFAINVEIQNMKKIASMTLPRSEVGVAHLFGCIYAIGGRGSTQKPISHVEHYCPPADIWRSIASLRRARIQPSATSADNIIYVVGGSFCNEFHVDTTCEYYDQTVNQWTMMSSLPPSFSESNVMIACHKERVYAIQCLKPAKLILFQSRQNKWMELDICNDVCRVVAFFSCNSLIWALDRSGKFFTYDDVNKQWTLVTKIPNDLTWPLSVYSIDCSM